MNDLYRFLVSASRDEIPRALVKPEDKEAYEPQEECQSTKSEQKVSPSHIVSPRARRGIGLTRKIDDQRPGNLLVSSLAFPDLVSCEIVHQTPKELSYCPPHSHDREQILVRRWYNV